MAAKGTVRFGNQLDIISDGRALLSGRLCCATLSTEHAPTLFSLGGMSHLQSRVWCFLRAMRTGLSRSTKG